jgi:putative nucleotidyltransferase with HDIG domain
VSEPSNIAGLTDPAAFWAMTVNHHPYVDFESQAPNAAARDDESLDIARLTTALIQKFEELTMIHQFTDQLRIDLDRDTICRDMIEPLSHCVNADTLAIELYRDDETNTESSFICVGVPQETDRMTRLADAAAQLVGDSMAILNHPFLDGDDSCRFIVVPISRVDYRAGRMIAIRKNQSDEFGSIEADLMRSLAMMLAVHLANQRQYVQLENTLDGALVALVSALDAKDRYTFGHSTRVSELSVAFARDLGMKDAQCEIVKKSALLHDIGKIGIDDSVLRKPGALTSAEFDLIKQHPVIGYEILKAIRPFTPLLPGVLHHHESWDGKGYPHGLVGDAIPRIAQIIAVADSFDAMISDRPYRDGMPLEQVRQIFQKGTGVQWAPDVASLLVSQIDKMFEMVRRDRLPTPS